jgi:hypothetical protein
LRLQSNPFFSGRKKSELYGSLQAADKALAIGGGFVV